MKLQWTSIALADLANIESWLTANVDPAMGEDMVERIRAQSRTLLHFPRRKPRLGPGRHYAQVAGAPFLLIYAVGKDAITILRVRHNRQDWRGGE